MHASHINFPLPSLEHYYVSARLTLCILVKILFSCLKMLIRSIFVLINVKMPQLLTFFVTHWP